MFEFRTVSRLTKVETREIRIKETRGSNVQLFGYKVKRSSRAITECNSHGRCLIARHYRAGFETIAAVLCLLEYNVM